MAAAILLIGSSYCPFKDTRIQHPVALEASVEHYHGEAQGKAWYV